MYPLSYTEVSGFDIEKAMVTGMLPPHFLSGNYKEDLRAYVADYLKEEIAAEARVQNIPSFNEFLRVAALTSSELLNYTNVASEAGLSQKQVRAYFDILEDTLLGFRLQPWRKSKNRRMILTEKFYLFDVGVANYLIGRTPTMQTPEFGKSFEHFILMELRAYAGYRQPDAELSYWRSAAGQEVDFIAGDKQLAIEVKGSVRVNEASLGAMRALKEDGPVKHRIVVSLEKQPRALSDGIKILPWQIFLEELWGGKYF
jgi:predicted AAA+ superfamily ATPase